MNYQKIIYAISMLVLVIGIGMFITLQIGYLAGDDLDDLDGIGISAVASLLFSLMGILFTARSERRSRESNSAREGFIIVALSWLAAIIFGSLPFVLCSHFKLADAIFETASGFSTTGASIIGTDLELRDGRLLSGGLESLTRGVLFWRSMLNWLGGIGFVMFALMLLPTLGGSKQIYNAEVPGLKNTGDQLTPRLVSTARLMLGFYVVWTLCVTIGYRCLGMSTWYDAVCHAFTTVSTGGYSTHSASFGFFHQPLLQWFSSFAMLASSLNMLLMVKLVMGHVEFHKDEETRWFFMIVVASSLLFTLQLVLGPYQFINMTDGTPQPTAWEPMLRTTFFQVISLMSTTGYATSDFITWSLPGLPAVIIFLMFCGGCGGSTAGGLKVIRLIVLFKQSVLELKRRLFPHLMPNVHIGNTFVHPAEVQQTMAFLFLYIGTIGICTILLPYLCSMDFDTAFSASVTAVSNVGPGLGKLSPSYTFAWMNAPAKYLLSFAMIAGRLELHTIFIIFLPCFWHTKQFFTSIK